MLLLLLLLLFAADEAVKTLAMVGRHGNDNKLINTVIHNVHRTAESTNRLFTSIPFLAA